MHGVAILGLFGDQNFGNSLQSAALTRAIRDMGYAPRTLAYAMHKATSQFEPVRWRQLFPRAASKLMKARVLKSTAPLRDTRRNQLFGEFLARHEVVTAPVATASDLYALNGDFDAFVCGSDQVWCPLWYNPRYFLDFVETPAKRVAYAASFGQAAIANPLIAAQMAARLKDFPHISVREDSGRRIVRDLIGREAPQVLDPTLLLDGEQWAGFANAAAVPDRPYLLCYIQGVNEGSWRRARAIARALKLPLCAIPMHRKDIARADIQLPPVGPAEFVALFQNAAYVCTDSFHGTAFAVNCRRPFAVFERDARMQGRTDARLVSILGLLGLERRLYGRGRRGLDGFDEPIDFDDVDRRLRAERARSLDYLRSALAAACAAPRADWSRVTFTCCGCGACVAVCPQGAIAIGDDGRGFRVPEIDADKCVRCDRCRDVCPFNGPAPSPLSQQRGLYAFKADAEALKASSSGGLSAALGECLAADGCAMAGCVYEPHLRRAVHRLAAPDDAALRRRFRGSKYIHSDIGAALDAARDGARDVLFVGTPCQVAAVARVLGERRDGWALVDMFCHGVPSDALWDKYIDWLERRHGLGPTPEINFRDKRVPWHESGLSASGNGSLYFRKGADDPFKAMYLQSLALRESCHECRFRRCSAADMRIGDFWGPRYDGDATGVSLALPMTARGEALIEALSRVPGAALEKRPDDEYRRGQSKREAMPVERDAVLDDLCLRDLPFEDAFARHCAPRLKRSHIYRRFRRLHRFLAKR